MIRTLAPWPALVALLLAACSADVPPAQTIPPVAAGTNTAVAAVQCPDSSFEQFLERFSSQISVQETATADPLLASQVNADAQPEPTVETHPVPLAEVLWPVMPDLRQARHAGREVQIDGEEDVRVVTVRTPDTSDQQRYHFQRQPCWTLIKWEDQSI